MLKINHYDQNYLHVWYLSDTLYYFSQEEYMFKFDYRNGRILCLPMLILL